MSYCPEDNKCLSDALTAHVSFHRTIALVTRHVHDKQEPDLDTVEELITKAERWLLTWEEAQRHAESHNWYECPLVEKYYQIPLREQYGRFQTIPGWARQILAEGGIPKIIADKQFVMRYDPLLFHEENTITLAQAVGMSLE